MWIITKDKIFDPNIDKMSNVGRASMDFNKKAFKEYKHIQFRLYDDDDNLYYCGLMDELQYNRADDGGPRSPFAPLDWAMHNAGCTKMKVKDPETGKWDWL